MQNNKAKEIWEQTWKPEVHTTEYALKRITSARSAKLTPIKIDTTDFYGYFQGNSGRYETFLDYCPCGDFHRSKLPCKHIYRLAIELGLMDVTAEHNVNAIPTPKSERLPLDDAINIVESLSCEAQYKLLDLSRQFNSITPTCRVFVTEGIAELLKSGLIIDADPQKHEIIFNKKSDMTELLDAENIPYDKKLKKEVLKALCIKFIPEQSEKNLA